LVGEVVKQVMSLPSGDPLGDEARTQWEETKAKMEEEALAAFEIE